MSLGDWEEGKKKRAQDDVNSTTQLLSFFFFQLFIFLLEYPAGGSMEKRATLTYNLSDFTIK